MKIPLAMLKRGSNSDEIASMIGLLSETIEGKRTDAGLQSQILQI